MKITWITIILLFLLQGCSMGVQRKSPAPVVYEDPAYSSKRQEPVQRPRLQEPQFDEPVAETAPADPYPEPAPMERYGDIEEPQLMEEMEPVAGMDPAEEVREVEEQTLAYAEPKPEPAPAFQPNRPVQALVEKADAQSAAGDLAGAGATLERALRIEPRNPHLLNRLARVRLQQGSLDQADSLASKSNALAGGDSALRRDNQEIISAARGAAGR